MFKQNTLNITTTMINGCSYSSTRHKKGSGGSSVKMEKDIGIALMRTKKDNTFEASNRKRTYSRRIMKPATTTKKSTLRSTTQTPILDLGKVAFNVASKEKIGIKKSTATKNAPKTTYSLIKTTHYTAKRLQQCTAQ